LKGVLNKYSMYSCLPIMSLIYHSFASKAKVL
jgi:hypothetical protein